jgi:hypothetical protein
MRAITTWSNRWSWNRTADLTPGVIKLYQVACWRGPVHDTEPEGQQGESYLPAVPAAHHRFHFFTAWSRVSSMDAEANTWQAIAAALAKCCGWNSVGVVGQTIRTMLGFTVRLSAFSPDGRISSMASCSAASMRQRDSGVTSFTRFLLPWSGISGPSVSLHWRATYLLVGIAGFC